MERGLYIFMLGKIDETAESYLEIDGFNCLK